jgi:hypothetical protein
VNPHEAIDRDFDAHLERIRDFLGIPSVSAHGGDLRSTADTVCELIDLAGGTAAPREPGEKRPTVIGVIEGPGPTVLRYGMYDVQPPGAQWTVAPFAAELIDGRIIARGAANSKGALAASILAFASAPSPCRQVFVPISATRGRSGGRACSVRAIAWPASAEPVNATPSMSAATSARPVASSPCTR